MHQIVYTRVGLPHPKLTGGEDKLVGNTCIIFMVTQFGVKLQIRAVYVMNCAEYYFIYTETGCREDMGE